MADPSHESLEPWPLHYVQTALWFLSATPADKAKYLPPPFPPVRFHGNLGDFETGNPLHFMVRFCADACEVGARIDEWMDMDPSGRVRDQFEELRALLHATIWEELEKWDPATVLRSPGDAPGDVYLRDMAGLLNASSRYSKAIIVDLDWSISLSSHKLRCESLLDEYSYGAYSAGVVTKPGAQTESADEG